MEYSIICRYQKLTREGVKWTPWFSRGTTKDLVEAKQMLKKRREDSKITDRVTKLKHQYEIYEHEDGPIDFDTLPPEFNTV